MDLIDYLFATGLICTVIFGFLMSILSQQRSKDKVVILIIVIIVQVVVFRLLTK